METLISDFLFCCSKFSDEKEFFITIKFHHLVHIPRLISKFGPPRFFSTLNFEQHNHFLKKLILNSSNWINPIETICTKYAQNCCIMKELQPVEINKVHYYGQLPQEIPYDLAINSTAFVLGSLLIDGIKYISLKSIIFVGKNECECLKFMLIEKIFLIDQNYYFFGQIFEGVYTEYNQINLFSLKYKFTIKHSSLFPNYSSYSLYEDNGQSYIIPYHWR